MGRDGTWPERFRRPWHVVRFNAWQHQHVAPPWWVFYETIRQCCAKGALSASGDAADEWLPPPDKRFAFGSPIMRLFDMAGLTAGEYLWRFFSKALLYSLVPLVLTVGAIFVLFRLGLLKPDGTLADSTTGGAAIILSVALGGGASVWKLWSSFTQTLLPGTPDAAKNFSQGADDPLKRMRAHFVRLMERVHRPVLVIVDDLDRCDPAFVVELVRGMQTILASPRIVYLLLGDRDWIEQSFTEVHKAMKGIEVGPEHRFGGRFVEKAIQFSMVLPDISNAGRSAYVRELLTPGGGAQAAQPVTEPPSVLDRIIVPDAQRETINRLRTATREALGTADYETREKLARNLAAEFDFDRLAVPKQEFEQAMAQKLFYRAATDSTAEKGTAHMLESLSSALPANPRQIKRIINTLSLLGQVLRIKDPDKRPGSPDWELLARWVVLMVEWPKSWFTLTRHPGLADMALALRDKKSEAELETLNSRHRDAGHLPAGGGREVAAAIATNSTVMSLLDFRENDWQVRALTAADILWLREVMPTASGQALTAEKGETRAQAQDGK
jgi:hypothetical protein